MVGLRWVARPGWQRIAPCCGSGADALRPPARLAIVLTIAFPAQAFDTNCYVLAPAAGEECLVVDPGIGVEDTLREVLAEHRLRPAAVLLTHGHVDHVYSVTPVCGSDTAAYIHADDRYRLTDLLAQIDPGLLAMLEQQFGQRVMFGLHHVPDGLGEQVEVDRTMISGDVLFAGSIGRTDLPGGSHDAMQRSLREVVLPLPDTTLVLPGHGPATTMAHERVTNPFLKDLPA